jgi:decaprenylphospho-beta-D-erythro-pentofuranosid-2-ulose 2-reductase
MPKVVLIGSTSELGNATALEFTSKFPERYLSVFRVGRSSISSDLVWTKPDDVYSCVISDLDSLDLKRNDLVIIALGYLSNGLLDSNLESLDLAEIVKTIEITGVVSSIVMTKITKLLSKVGGGDIIVFSSVAASPVLKANLFYGASKNFLEKITAGLRTAAAKNNVRISIIRPGFVETKLNEHRKKTSFSATTDQVAKDIVRKFPKQNIYTPTVFRIIEFALVRSRFLRFMANRRIINSFVESDRKGTT